MKKPIHLLLRTSFSLRQAITVTAMIFALGTGHALARPLGIDVSRFQGTINWTSVKNGGYTFSWAQATRGNYLTNNNYVANMNNGKAAAVLMGSYHYATPATNSAATEAAYFWNRAGAHILADGKTLMPMLDIEEFNGHVGASSYSEWANQWATWVINKAASNGVNIKIVLYSSASFMCNFDSSCSGFGSWVANYNGLDPQTGTPWDCCTSCNLWGGGAWDFWQYSSTGSVPGVTGNCDLDVFNGTFAQMTNAWKATALAAPVISNVSATPGDVGANITWDTDINANSVVNYGLTTSYGSTVSNGTMVVNHSINLSSLTPSTLYHYRVKSKNASGVTSTSGDFTFTTLASGQVSDIIIDNPAATITGTWATGTSATDKYGSDYRNKSGGTGAAFLTYTPTIVSPGNYNVYEWHSQGANRTSAGQVTVSYNGGSQLFQINQQAGGGQWNLLGTFNFVAGSFGFTKIADNHPDSGQVVIADAIKWSYVPPTPPPAAPSGLAATAVSSSQINLAWTDNSTNESNFIVSRSTTSGGPYSDIATVGANVTSYNNTTGLLPNTTYYYVVRARGAGGDSATCPQASARTFDVAPAAPSGLTATAVSSSQINLSWTDNSSNESGFIVGRSTTSGGPYTDIVSLGVNTTSYANSGLTAATTYYYVVRATNAVGSSANSAQASATTFPNPPAAPSGLTATAISSSEIDLAWTDNSSNEDSFIVARSNTSGGPYTDIATLSANSTSYPNTGLASGTTYYYVVRASNTGGDSANSAQASATTQSAAPGEIIVDNPSATVVGTWTTGTTAPDRFGADYYYNGPGTGAEYVQFTPTIPATANYDVYEWHSAGANRTTDGELIVNFKGGSQSFILNQTAGGGQWNFVGTFSFAAGTAGNVRLTDNYTTGSVIIADAVRFVPNTNAVADIIIDNPSASVTGTWSSGTGSTDKFGTDYRFKNQGTGSAFLTYTPNFLVAANYQVYEWHPQGTNRTTNAPVVINYNGGTRTNFINQKVNGGTWVAVGTKVNFVAGNFGSVKITDAIPDSTQVVMADAIKFVFSP